MQPLAGVSTNKRVFIFLDTMPQRQGSGASLRFYSNIRSYLDAGFSPEVIQIATAPDNSQPSEDLTPVVWTRVIEPAQPSTLVGRLWFRGGVPTQSSLDYYVPLRRIVKKEVEKRLQTAPDAIYHFEGEWLSTVGPWLPKGTRALWSLHDLVSSVTKATTKIACDAQQRTPTRAERRELRFARNMERVVARSFPLIIGISKGDCDLLRSDWGLENVEFLPMSIPGDGAPRNSPWMPDGQLRLLHLGRISHLPSYRSLEFLFEEIFPRLSTAALSRIILNVVGRVDNDQRSQRIRALAARYPNVQFHGFVDDVVPYYQNSDVQVVASTDATGLRTRTIESFAYGLPVLSTTVGAQGIDGLTAGEDLLIADTADEFARLLTDLTQAPATLSRLSKSGRSFYERKQSRPVVASLLASYLEKYFFKNQRFCSPKGSPPPDVQS